MTYQRILTTIIVVFSLQSYGQDQCGEVFNYQAPYVDPLINADLLTLQGQETAGQERAAIEQMNKEALSSPLLLPLAEKSKRVATLTQEQMEQVISSIRLNPITKKSHSMDYNHPDVAIGYCFGVATYLHLTLLKMGVDRNSIRKAWAVGKFNGGTRSWQFHVATMVLGADKKWYVLDEYFHGLPVELEAWFQKWEKQSADKKMRLYVTSPQKFSVSLGTYDQVQMGLRLPKESDWYKGFFQHLMKWFQTGKLEDVGLQKLNQASVKPPAPKTLLDRILNIF